MSKVTLKELHYWERRLNDKTIEEILKILKSKFKDKIGIITAFGYSGIVLLHYIYKLGLDIESYFIDTGYHFKETLDFAKMIEKKWNLKVKWISIDTELRDYMLKTFGDKPWEVNNNICCHYCKVEPLLRILPEKDVWLSALRRDQSYTRSSIDVAEIDGRGSFRVYPMADWTRDKVWKFIYDNKLPYNPLYDRHYPSIGCEPCTLPVEKGGDERDGRWKLSQKLECGIHIHR